MLILISIAGGFIVLRWCPKGQRVSTFIIKLKSVGVWKALLNLILILVFQVVCWTDGSYGSKGVSVSSPAEFGSFLFPVVIK